MTGLLQSTFSQPETLYLLSIFVSALGFLYLLEQMIPRESGAYGSRAARNVAFLVGNALIKLFLPISLVAASLFGIFEQFGLLNMVKLGLWTKIILAWLVLDLFSYGLHRAFHHFSWLWRIHQVHHTDARLDVTTPFRTHPLELIITLCVKASIVLLFGMPLLGVILYEVIVAVMAIWVHANIRINQSLDRHLSWLLVTPNFHSLHHGATLEECKRNFGLVLTVWDRLFGTCSQITHDSDIKTKRIDVSEKKESIAALLLLPFGQAKR